MTKYNTVSVRLPAELQASLRAYSAQNNVPVNRIITEACSRHLADNVETLTTDQKIDLIIEYLKIRRR